MTTTKDMLRGWFDRGVEQGAAYMVIRWDSFDGDDYPSFHKTAEEALRVKAEPGEMQRVSEIYDLRVDREEQIAQKWVMAL